jgi:hypothetical protein
VTNTTILGLAKDTRIDLQYQSAQQAKVDNQSFIWIAGKGLGGLILINGESAKLFCHDADCLEMTCLCPASSQIDL